MKAIWGWIKKHWVKTILIMVAILLALIIPPIVVHWMFKTPARNSFFEQTWGPGDLITYIAGFEAFIGTVFLGSIAVNQNKHNIEINDRLLGIEEASSRFQRYPNLKVDSLNITRAPFENIPETCGMVFWKYDFEVDIRKNPEIFKEPLNFFSFVLKNVSDYNVTIYVENLDLNSWSKESPTISYNTQELGIHSKYRVIEPKQGLKINFCAYDSYFTGMLMCSSSMDIIVENNLKEKFRCSIEFIIIMSLANPYFKVLTERTVPLA